MSPDEIQSLVLYRDGLILVLNKPSGIPVHAGPGGGDNLERYFTHLRFGLPHPPALAHRLDRDTSGCLVLGRHRKALAKLGRLFQEGKIEKTYWAIVHGTPPQEAGTIDMPLLKISTKKGGWRMIKDATGQRAITDYKMIGHHDNLSWLELRPRTGRTHQIRVHCKEIGCPILGDLQYGAEPTAPNSNRPPLHLHARALLLPLYEKKPPLSIIAPPPNFMKKTLCAFGWRESVSNHSQA